MTIAAYGDRDLCPDVMLLLSEGCARIGHNVASVAITVTERVMVWRRWSSIATRNAR